MRKGETFCKTVRTIKTLYSTFSFVACDLYIRLHIGAFFMCKVICALLLHVHGKTVEHASAALLGLSDLVPSLSAAVPAHSASQREQSASVQWREPSLFLLFSRLVTGFLQQKIRTLTLFSPGREPLRFVLECLDCKSRVNFDWGPVLSLN